MPKLQTLDATASQAQLLQVLDRDGACIIADLLPQPLRDQIVEEVMPYVAQTRFGGDDFFGDARHAAPERWLPVPPPAEI